MAQEIKCESDCRADILARVKEENEAQWTAIDDNRKGIRSVLTRLNITMGGVCIACIMLAINIIINKGG